MRTLAGALTSGYADGVGAAARFFFPVSVAADPFGNVFVADANYIVVRAIVVATGAVTTLAGGGGVGGVASGAANGVGSAAMFKVPAGVATDGAGNVYVADAGNNLVRAIVIATGAVRTLAGGGALGNLTGAQDGVGSNALFRGPTGVAVGGAGVAGALFVADSANNIIRAGALLSGAVPAALP